MDTVNKEIFGFSKAMLLQCIILFLGICGGLWISKYIYILIAIITIIICFTKSINNIYYQLFFSVSFTVIYKLSPSSTSIFAYVMIVSGVILIVRIKTFNVKQLAAILFFSIYLIIGMDSNYTIVIKMIMGIILFYFFVKKIKVNDFKNHIMAFTLGVIGSSIVGSFRNNSPQISEYFKTEYTVYNGTDLSYRFTGLNYDPNFYAMSVVFAVVLCVMLLMNRTGNKVIMWILLILLLVFGLQSYSKMFLLSVMIVGIISIIYMARSPKAMIVALVSLLTFGTGVIIWLKKIGYMDIMFNRLFKGDISTGRFEIWKTYFEYLAHSPFTFIFGDGIGASYLSIGGPHNTYFESIFFVGIMGSILFLYMLISVFRCRKYNSEKKSINYLLLFVFLIMIGVLGCFTINEFFFYCMLIWLGLNINVESKTSILNEGENEQCIA